MDIKEYIESGILEAYVLNALTPEEQLEVANTIAQYPELAAEVKAIEEGLLSFARAGAATPPDVLKEQIWDAIVKPPEPAVKVEMKEERRTDNVRSFTPATSPARPSWQRAAVWAAVVVSVLTNFILLSQKNKINQERIAMQQQLDSIGKQQQYFAQVIANYEKEREMLADTAMQTVVMKTMQSGHPMAATIHWNKQTGTTYLSINKLPPPPSGKQYQMWVIQNGKPVSMGVIPDEMTTIGSMTKLPMKVMDSQAFAISLEKMGGSESPSMFQIQVMGKVT